MKRPDEVTEYLRCGGANCDGACNTHLDKLGVEDCLTWRVHGYIQKLEERIVHLESLNQQNLSVITMQERTRAILEEQISQLESSVPRWISVEERLPDMGVNVLLLHPHMCEWDDSLPTVEYIVVTGELCTAFGCKKKNAWNVHRKVYDLGEERDLSYATHWMTIPTPPEPPKENA